LHLQIKIVFAGSFSTDSSNALRKNVKFGNCNGLSPLPRRRPEQPNPPEESEQDPDWHLIPQHLPVSVT
jgi:uracil-DNA glycosylase